MTHGTVTIHRVTFTEDEVFIQDEAGNVVDFADIPYDDDHTSTEVHDNLTAREAADLLIGLGLSFAATGSDWAADPDGSYISDYRTAERVETSGHLSGFPDRVLAAIESVVG